MATARLPVVFLLALTTLAFSFSSAMAAEYTLAWDPNAEPDVAGYKVYWGTRSRTYTSQLDVGNATSHTFTGLDNGQVYYFVVAAYDTLGTESDFSVEVSAASRFFLFGIDKTADNGGWVEVVSPGYEHQHWLKVDWPDYNALGGQSRLATGDIDGDGLDEIVIGLGQVDGFPGLPQGRFEILDHDYTHLAWGQVEWDDYNAVNGETWPATGDLNGDGTDEILIGLGRGGHGNVAVYAFVDGGLVLQDWVQLDWPEYNENLGEVRPAAGDLDGDRKDEVILGLGRREAYSSLQGGLYRVLDHDLTPLAWGVVDWPDYNSLNGETRPCTGDLDGDGRDEILIGLGPGGEGMVALAGLAGGTVQSLSWLNIGWEDYALHYGETRPVTDDIDLDGRDEILVGLGEGGLGRNIFFDDLEASLAHLTTLEIWPQDYANEQGGSWPAIQRRPPQTEYLSTEPNSDTTDTTNTTDTSPPIVSITSPVNGASSDSGASTSFAGSASDSEDGDLTGSLAWASDLDGQIGTGGSFFAELSEGTHTITASVTDSGGNTSSDSIAITVGGGGSGGDFTLSVSAYKVRGRQHADLAWSGATSTKVDVYRDGIFLVTSENDGAYTHSTDIPGGGSATYQICEQGTTPNCSNEVTVTW